MQGDVKLEGWQGKEGRSTAGNGKMSAVQCGVCICRVLQQGGPARLPARPALQTPARRTVFYRCGGRRPGTQGRRGAVCTVRVPATLTQHTLQTYLLQYLQKEKSRTDF